MKTRVFVDMDGTLARFNPSASIETVATKGYFRNLEPMETVVDTINKLIAENEYDVFILSSVFADNHSSNDKLEWLSKYIPYIKKENILFVPYGMNKSDYLNERLGNLYKTDFLIDDFSENLKAWHGVPIKVLNGINGRNGTFKGFRIFADSDASIFYNTLKGILAVS